MHEDLATILIDRDTIADRIEILAAELEHDLQAKINTANLIVLPVMTGSVVFLADLMRHLRLRFRIEPVRAVSYVGQTTSPTQAVVLKEMDEGLLRDSHVLIIDDVLDSGRTLAALRSRAHAAGARSVAACVLLRKLTAPDVPCEYVGFDIPDVFVVGYGLDYDGLYRNLPDLGVLRPDLVSSDPEASA